jgi:putative membrane protein
VNSSIRILPFTFSFASLNAQSFLNLNIMKKILWLLMMPLGMVACNNSASDSVEKADSVNEAKSDSGNNNANTSNNNNKNGVLGVDESTSSFMVHVADVGMTEVKLGEIAEKKATNKRVKAFARMMVDDHSKANEELKSLAASKNVTLPKTVGEDHQKKIDDLNKKTGKDFDRAYMDMMEDGHESTVKDFEGKTDNSDADVKAFVNKTLPTLRMHLDSAKAIKKAIK